MGDRGRGGRGRGGRGRGWGRGRGRGRGRGGTNPSSLPESLDDDDAPQIKSSGTFFSFNPNAQSFTFSGASTSVTPGESAAPSKVKGNPKPTTKQSKQRQHGSQPDMASGPPGLENGKDKGRRNNSRKEKGDKSKIKDAPKPKKADPKKQRNADPKKQRNADQKKQGPRQSKSEDSTKAPPGPAPDAPENDDLKRLNDSASIANKNEDSTRSYIRFQSQLKHFSLSEVAKSVPNNATVLCMAEKPSLAASIACFLAEGERNVSTRRSFQDVHEFSADFLGKQAKVSLHLPLHTPSNPQKRPNTC